MNQQLRKSVYRQITRSIDPHLEECGDAKHAIHQSVKKAVHRFVFDGKIRALHLVRAIEDAIRHTVKLSGLVAKTIQSSILRALKRYLPPAATATATALAVTGPEGNSAEPMFALIPESYVVPTGALTVATASPAEPPNNAELFQMIMEVRGQNQALNNDLDRASNQIHHALRQNSSSGGFFAGGEALFLQPVLNDLHFAILNSTSTIYTSSSGYSITDASLITHEPGYDVGFRVEAGWEVPFSGQSIGVLYSRLNADSSTTVNANGDILQPTNYHPYQYFLADSAVASYELDYDVVDIEAAQSFRAGSDFRIRVLGGLRIADIDHQLKARYVGSSFTSTPGETLEHSSSFTGIGPRVGTEMTWDIRGSGLVLFGGAKGSVMVGQYRYRYDQSWPSWDTIIYNQKEDSVVPALETNVGIGYERRHLSIRAGWQLENWFNIFGTGTFNDAISGSTVVQQRKDLALHGVVMQVTYRH